MKEIKSIVIIMLFISLNSQIFGQESLYLGQAPPTTFVKRFPPANFLSTPDWFWHGTPCFSPAGDEMYFVKYFTATDKTQIWYSKCVNNIWSDPMPAPFAGTQYTTNNPVFKGSNDTLYFQSSSPDAFVYYVTRIDTSWSAPKPIMIPFSANMQPGFQFAISGSGTIYLEITDTNTNNLDLYYSECINGIYQTPINMGNTINSSSYEWGAFISADEKTIFFASNKEGGFGYHDIYMSRKNENNTWGTPINLTVRINGTFEDAYPYISPDGKYFFFTAHKANDIAYNPYWISMDYINGLITDVEEEFNPNYGFKLDQNYPNPFNPTTTIRYALPKSEFVTLKVYDTLGKEVANLVSEFKNPGAYEVCFNGSKLSSGTYFYKLESGALSETKKLLLLK